jgi:hypothetical protein
MRLPTAALLGLALASLALGREPSFQEHAAVQKSLSRVHPRVPAMAVLQVGISH